MTRDDESGSRHRSSAWRRSPCSSARRAHEPRRAAGTRLQAAAATARGRWRRRRATASSITCSSTRPYRSQRHAKRPARSTSSPSSRLQRNAGTGATSVPPRGPATTRAPARGNRVTGASSSSTPSATSSRAAGRSSTSRARRRSSTRMRPAIRSSSSARCGARETERSVRRRPGRSCAGTPTSCARQGKKRGLKPPASGVCPPGSRLTQGASEMLHVWFTRGSPQCVRHLGPDAGAVPGRPPPARALARSS